MFLADRNVLIDQTMINDFRPFSGKMAKLSTRSKTIKRPDGSKEDVTLALDKKRRIDPSYEIYLGLYQAITGPLESQKIFKEFSKDFFDLIIIDECHRGSASADSAWREILTHFSSAVQIGLTATPKETEYESNIDYFGPPAFGYTLKQGIRDGFLAPYKVVKVHIDRDIEGYRPEQGQLDRDGEEVEVRVYNAKDFDRTLVLDDRTKLVAAKVTEFLRESGDPMAKTIVFCVDQEHAARMRQALINENADLVAKNSHYVMRITGSDKDGIDQLGNFIDPEAPYPVIVTTSKLLSTGVDAQTCRLIVLDREVGSMTEFKQIVGRGTRVHEDTKKLFFTLMDFRGASSHFADPEFDGEPVQIYQAALDDSVTPPDETQSDNAGDGHENTNEPGDETILIDPKNQNLGNGSSLSPRPKVYVDGIGADIVAERVEYLDANGRLVTESLRDYTRKAMRKRFTSLDDFLRRWSETERKHALIEQMAEEGLPLDVISKELGLDLDPFDLICHVAFDAKPLTRQDRANNVRKRDAFAKYGPQARAVLEALLEKYADDGVISIDDPKILKINPFSGMGTEVELIRAFGKRNDYVHAVHEMQAVLYNESA